MTELTNTEPEITMAGTGYEPAETDARIPIFPDLFISGLTAMVLLLCLYSVLCIFLPAGLDVRANTFAAPADLKPAWYLLFLYEGLRSAAPIARALAPLLLILLIAALPFLDRNPSRELRHRPFALVLGALLVAVTLGLSYLGWTG